jgi:uncharacterized protein DUF6335
MARRKLARAKKKTAKRSRKPAGRRKAAARSARAKARKRAPARKRAAKPKKAVVRTPPARLARDRRVLEDDIVPTPPSSLNMDRRGSAVRTGRAEIAQHRKEHATMTPAIAGGDVDVDVQDAYFSGDEAPGGDNPTPDQDIVDDIGKAIGVQYQDDEELGDDKITGRDKHRWELDPASSDDYKDRD